MKFVPEGLSRAVSRTVLKGQMNSPAILLGVGVIGVIATAVMASKATLELEKVFDETDADLARIKAAHEDKTLVKYDTKKYQRDQVVIYSRTAGKITRLYAPSVVVGALTVMSFAGSNLILARRNASLMAAYALLETGFARYRQRVVDELGPEKDREFRYELEACEIAEDTDHGVEIVQGRRVGPNGISIYARIFDQMNPKWSKDPEMNLMFLHCQQDYANDKLKGRGHVFLNDIYDALGFERTQAGQIVGWVYGGGGDDYVDFGIFHHGTRDLKDNIYGVHGAAVLDFNVDGVVWDKLRNRE